MEEVYNFPRLMLLHMQLCLLEQVEYLIALSNDDLMVLAMKGL